MANLRIIDTNTADISLTLTASTTAGALAASNLLTDIKSQVWRSTATSARLTLTWTDLRLINAVILPQTNFTNTATMRIRGYSLIPQTCPALQRQYLILPLLSCCGYTSAEAMGWDKNIPGVSNFGYGGGVYAGLYFADYIGKKALR